MSLLASSVRLVNGILRKFYFVSRVVMIGDVFHTKTIYDFCHCHS